MGNWKTTRSIIPAVWLIGLGILWLFDLWWPGILILIGITMLIEVANRDTKIATPPAVHSEPEVVDVAEVNETDKAETEEATITETPASEPAVAETDVVVSGSRLPSTCPMCGAPVDENKVKWRDLNEAHCAFCDSKLPLGLV